MYRDLYSLRTKYGEVYVTVFPDGTKVPWEQLSVEDFIHYSNKFTSGRFPESHTEDEIFRKCCKDPTLVASLDHLDAGLITTVVTQIMEISGPSTTQEISFDLNVARSQVGDFISDGVGLICQTFPGYTPETVLQLDYRTFMKRLALAERRLLAMGILQQPIIIESGEEEPAPTIQDKWANLNPAPVTAPRETSRPLPPSPSGLTIKQEQMRETIKEESGHDLLDKELWEHDVMNGLEFIYPELFEKLRAGEKITPEVINQTKGATPLQVKNKYNEYKDKLKSGEIQPTESKYLIANKIEGASNNKKRRKAVARVKRG